MDARNPRHFEPPVVRRRRHMCRRTWAIALLTFRQGMRMRLWLLVPLAVAILVLADLSSPRFDPVFEAVPAAVGTSLLVMAVLAVVVGVFFATYPIPAEMESKVAYSVVTKPLSAIEIVAGRTVGLSVLVLAMLGLVAAGAYAYVAARAGGIQSLAASRLEEARPRAVHPADLNALEAAARQGPLITYRYQAADAGPEVAIHYAEGPPEAPGVRWVVGRTGMRLRWTLPQSPLREWLASGPVRVRAALQVHRPPSATDEPEKLIALTDVDAAGARRTRAAEGQPKPTSMVEAVLRAEGSAEVRLAAPDSPPAKDVLNAQAEGDILFDVMADNIGHLVGARAGSLTVVGPGDQEIRIEAAPEVVAARQFGRVMLVGRPELPREVAVFRFDDVPASVLPAGDVAVEMGFTLDAWGPATIQPGAEATFVNPKTGARKAFQFTPEGHHSTLLYLDHDFWHGGPLEVRLEGLTADDFIGLLPASVQLRLDGGPFALHLARATLSVWLFGTVLAAMGVFVSTRLSWFVGILATCVLFILGIGRDAILDYPLMRFIRMTLAKAAATQFGWTGLDDVIQRVILPLPDLKSLLPADAVSMGQVLPLADLAASFGWAALAAAVLVVLGAWLLKTREVAA